MAHVSSFTKEARLLPTAPDTHTHSPNTYN